MSMWSLGEGGFTINQPLEYRPWLNYLGNGEYGLRISHLGDGYATTLREPRKVITNYDFFTPNKGRFLYIQDGESLWTPSFYPVKQSLDSYSCTHRPGSTGFSSENAGVLGESIHFLPRTGSFEIWYMRIQNNSDRQKQIQVVPQLEFLLYDTFAVDPVYYSWYTNSGIEDGGHTITIFKTDTSVVYGFCSSISAPQGWESSLVNFRGNGDVQRPQGVMSRQFTGRPSAGDPYIAAFQFILELEPGQVWENALFIGEGRAHCEDARKRFSSLDEVKDELQEVHATWEKRLFRKEHNRITDSQFRNYLNTFMPYQMYQQSEGLVRSTFRGFRDVAQDAMGMSYYDLDLARALIESLPDKQCKSGRCLRQWNTGGGYHDERDFRDLPFWLPLAVGRYIEKGGDPSILGSTFGYHDDPEEETLVQHMVRGLRYGLEFGPHDLLCMGKGDWNDALSGMGSKGESLWLNQIAYLSLQTLDDMCSRWGYSHGLEVEALTDRLYRGVLNGWTGTWFIRGIHENGTVLGGTEDDRIFLLPQAWFTISGMDKRNPEIAGVALESMLSRCDNESGLLICDPGFPEFNPLVGNLSALAPGMAENFAVYNHASAFGIYALLKAGRLGDAQRFIQRLLPFKKNPEQSHSEPYVLVNYYNGGFYPEKAGRGGIPWLTSTVSWLAMGLFDYYYVLTDEEVPL